MGIPKGRKNKKIQTPPKAEEKKTEEVKKDAENTGTGTEGTAVVTAPAQAA